MHELYVGNEKYHTFAGGRGRVFDIHAKATTYPVYTPGTIIIIATYRGAVVVVEAAMMKAITAKYKGSVTWK